MYGCGQEETMSRTASARREEIQRSLASITCLNWRLGIDLIAVLLASIQNTEHYKPRSIRLPVVAPCGRFSGSLGSPRGGRHLLRTAVKYHQRKFPYMHK